MYKSYICCNHDYIKLLLCREDRAAKALLVTAQYNQKFGHSSKSPEFPQQMMSQDRKTRVCVIEEGMN